MDRSFLHLMTTYPKSFVGFFNAAADALEHIGNEWLNYGKANNKQLSIKWGTSFLLNANAVRNVAINLATMDDEFNLQEFKDSVNVITATKN